MAGGQRVATAGDKESTFVCKHMEECRQGIEADFRVKMVRHNSDSFSR